MGTNLLPVNTISLDSQENKTVTGSGGPGLLSPLPTER